MTEIMSAVPRIGYQETWDRSQSHRDDFWLEAAKRIDWDTVPQTALEQRSETEWRWFPDGTLNVCANALDRHIDAGRGDAIALIADSAMTGTRQRISYSELRDRVATFAGALRSLGVEKGDRVLIYCPMTPEAVVAMLACARLGAIHSVVFGGFAANELATRIDDAKPSVIVTSSGGLEPGRQVRYLPLVHRALEICGEETSGVNAVVVANRDEVPGSAADYADDGAGTVWHDWDTLVAGSEPADPVPVNANDPLYILYTSGTTGSPKGIVRDSGGYAVALSWVMRGIYDFGPGDTIFTASDVGWVVGHSFIVYGPLIAGGTTVLYEGKPVGTPDAGAFWRVLAETGAKISRPPRQRSGRSGAKTQISSSSRSTTSRTSARSTSPVNAWTPRRGTGCVTALVCQSWTTGGRRKPAGRSARTRSASKSCR